MFVVAGQSNAAGRAKNPVEDAPELGVHLLRDSGIWDLATHPLGETTGSVHQGHFENHNPGHTPWLHFAKLLKRELGYPIGIVMSAYGGARCAGGTRRKTVRCISICLSSLQITSCTRRPCLVPGEARVRKRSGDLSCRFTQFVGALRRDLNQPELPVITVQLNRCMTPCDTALDRQWGMVRQAQVAAARSTPACTFCRRPMSRFMIFIHNSSTGQPCLG